MEAILHRLLDLPVQASEMAPHLDNLQYVEFAFFWFLGIITFAITGWFALRYRRGRRGETTTTPEVHSPVWLEVAVCVFLLAFFLAFWVVGFRQYIDTTIAPKGALDVYVTAKQWVWKFTYADGQDSAGVLYVPEGRPVRLLLTSRDVIHSFFVPAFRIKQDALPGRYTSTWFKATRVGRYQLFCAELCGAGHARMWGTVVVLPEQRFEQWLTDHAPEDQGTAGPPDAAHPLAQDEPTPAGGWSTPRGGQAVPPRGLARRGLQAATLAGCMRCHTPDGTEHIGPTWLGLYGSKVKLKDGSTVVADEDYLTRSMMDPMADIVAGYPPAMPTYQGRLDPPQTAAILAYIKYLRNPGPVLDSVIPREPENDVESSGAPKESGKAKEDKTP
jgi:cytochrome c oxidase subunit 2